MLPRRSRPLLLAALLGLASCNDGDDGPTNDAASDPTGGTDATASGSDDAGSDVWGAPYCEPVRDGPDWPGELRAWEDEVLRLTNAARAAGADCASGGKFDPTTPLTMNASLRCAARKHSKDMATRDFFDHTNPEGEDPFDRIGLAGYGSYSQAGENIAAGTDTPQATVDGWLASPGHCANIMSPNYSELGVGAFEGPGEYVYYWTQTFGRPL